MKPNFLDSVLRGAEALAARDSLGLLPDPELLRRFSQERDPQAFAVLVRRHGPLVWGVCRHMLIHDAEAEDAFQATFLALVNSSRSVQKPEALGAWLHGVAYRVAMKARRSAARRKQRESKAASGEQTDPIAEATWDQLQAAVHDEVCRLPEKLRLPFVLVDLQGRPQKEAAKQLGCTLGTFTARLCQARQKLLERLTKRGATVGLVVGSTALGIASSAAAVPSKLMAKTFNVVSAPDAVTPSVLSLSRGVTSMYLTRTKVLVAGFVLAGILTTGIGSRFLSTADAQTPETIAEVERKLEKLREEQRTKARWQYKFVPMPTALSATDLQRVLDSYDAEGWEYCGSQELVSSGKTLTHLTFKRANKVAAVKTIKDDDREKKLLESLKQYLNLEYGAKEKDKSKSDKTPANIDLVEQLYQRALEAQREAVAQAKTAEARALESVNARLKAEVEARRAVDADERAKAEAELGKVAQRAQAIEPDRAAQLQKEIEVLREQHELLQQRIHELQGKKPAPDAKDGKPVTVIFALKHVDTKTAAAALTKLIPGLETVGNASSNSLVVKGNATQVDEAKAILAKIDASGGPSADGGKSSVEVKLKNLTPDQASSVLAKAIRDDRFVISIIGGKNSIRLAGPKDLIEKATKVLEAADAASSKPAK